jgi:hypothetical protein
MPITSGVLTVSLFEEGGMATLRVGIPARGSLIAILIVAGLAASACSGSGVTAPGVSSSVAPKLALSPASAAVDTSPMSRLSSRPFGQTTNTYSLSNGKFTVTASPVDSFGGDYTGLASVSSSGRPTATLDLNVSTGTGVFAGALGSLSGVGAGAFIGEGPFSLGLDGFISTTLDRRFRVKLEVTGTSSASCSPPNIVLTLNGTGDAAKVGNVQTQFNHVVVGSANCGP